jgi:hypothetical protein
MKATKYLAFKNLINFGDILKILRNIGPPVAFAVKGFLYLDEMNSEEKVVTAPKKRVLPISGKQTSPTKT